MSYFGRSRYNGSAPGQSYASSYGPRSHARYPSAATHISYPSIQHPDLDDCLPPVSPTDPATRFDLGYPRPMAKPYFWSFRPGLDNYQPDHSPLYYRSNPQPISPLAPCTEFGCCVSRDGYEGHATASTASSLSIGPSDQSYKSAPSNKSKQCKTSSSLASDSSQHSSPVPSSNFSSTFQPDSDHKSTARTKTTLPLWSTEASGRSNPQPLPSYPNTFPIQYHPFQQPQAAQLPLPLPNPRTQLQPAPPSIISSPEYERLLYSTFYNRDAPQLNPHWYFPTPFGVSPIPLCNWTSGHYPSGQVKKTCDICLPAFLEWRKETLKKMVGDQSGLSFNQWVSKWLPGSGFERPEVKTKKGEGNEWVGSANEFMEMFLRKDDENDWGDEKDDEKTVKEDKKDKDDASHKTITKFPNSKPLHTSPAASQHSQYNNPPPYKQRLPTTPDLPFINSQTGTKTTQNKGKRTHKRHRSSSRSQLRNFLTYAEYRKIYNSKAKKEAQMNMTYNEFKKQWGSGSLSSSSSKSGSPASTKTKSFITSLPNSINGPSGPTAQSQFSSPSNKYHGSKSPSPIQSRCRSPKPTPPSSPPSHFISPKSILGFSAGPRTPSRISISSNKSLIPDQGSDRGRKAAAATAADNDSAKYSWDIRGRSLSPTGIPVRGRDEERGGKREGSEGTGGKKDKEGKGRMLFG